MLTRCRVEALSPLTLAGWLGAAAVFALSAGCGGGGGGTPPPPAPALSLSTSTLAFSAASPFAPTPNGQPVTATVSGTVSGTLYVVVVVGGTAVSTVSNFTVSGSSGQATVSVKPPTALGTGTYTSTLTVHACVNDQTCATGELSGSPKTVAVTYTINATPPPPSVMPHVVVTGASGQVTIRGSGLAGTTSVSFGATAGTVLSATDTQVIASYPAALSAGSMPLQLNGGGIAFTGSVFAVAPVAYAPTTLAYPATPGRVLATLYDAQRQVLYVALGFQDPNTNQLLRYSYSSSWGMPVATTIPALRDLTLSADGSQLLVLTNYTLLTRDAANFTGVSTSSISPGTASGGNLTGYTGALALANDGNILLTTGQIQQYSVSPTFLYTPSPQGFFDLGADNNLSSDDTGAGAPATLVASADGSTVLGTESSVNKRVLRYLAVSQQLTQIAEQMQPPGQPAAVDNTGSRIVVYDGSYIYVYDASAAAFGAEGPMSTGNSGARVVLVNPQGTRLYVITQAQMLWTLDTTAPAPGTSFNQVGQAVPVALPVVTSPILRTAVSADGQTLFVAGDGGVAVIPAPQ